MRARSGTTPSSSSSKMVRRYISVVSISPWAVNSLILLLLMLCRGASAVDEVACRRPRTASLRAQGPWLGGEPLDAPAVPLPPVAQPVMQPVHTRLPEFHRLRSQQVAAPEVGHGNGPGRRPALLELGRP